MPPSGSKVVYHHQLQQRRKPRKRSRVGARPELSVELVLEWADAFQARSSRWPKYTSGRVPESRDDTWNAVDNALRKGNRGLVKGGSLAQLLTKHRGVRNRAALPKLTVKQILSWADSFHGRTGGWPRQLSGRIADSPEDTWAAVDASLRLGLRGLAKGSSLARLLAKRRGGRNHLDVPKLTVRQILEWADTHRHRTGVWPRETSGPIHDAPGETWSGIHSALHAGGRGLNALAGSTLSQLLAQHRGVRQGARLPELTVGQILGWADAHHGRTGQWPRSTSGPIVGAAEETWLQLNASLVHGNRSLPRGLSLAKLLKQHRGV